MMWGYDGFGFGWGGMGIGMLLFWALIVAAIVVAARGFGARARTALDILGERYARGEIGKAEFDEKRRDLSAG